MLWGSLAEWWQNSPGRPQHLRSPLGAVKPEAAPADELVDLLRVVAVLGGLRAVVDVQDADVDLRALLKSPECRVANQHGALLLAVHDAAEVLAQHRLRLPWERLEELVSQEEAGQAGQSRALVGHGLCAWANARRGALEPDHAVVPEDCRRRLWLQVRICARVPQGLADQPGITLAILLPQALNFTQ